MRRLWSYTWRSLMLCAGVVWIVAGCISLATAEWRSAWLIAVGFGALALYGRSLARLRRAERNRGTSPE